MQGPRRPYSFPSAGFLPLPHNTSCWASEQREREEVLGNRARRAAQRPGPQVDPPSLGPVTPNSPPPSLLPSPLLLIVRDGVPVRRRKKSVTNVLSLGPLTTQHNRSLSPSKRGWGRGTLPKHLGQTTAAGETLTRGGGSCKGRTQSTGLNARPRTGPGNWEGPPSWEGKMQNQMGENAKASQVAPVVKNLPGNADRR